MYIYLCVMTEWCLGGDDDAFRDLQMRSIMMFGGGLCVKISFNYIFVFTKMVQCCCRYIEHDSSTKT